jgi:hypothetical protein
MQNFTKLNKNLVKYLEAYYKEHKRPGIVFHTEARSASIVKYAVKAGIFYELPAEELFAIGAACWFHALGYLHKEDDPLAKSAELAVTYLTKVDVTPATIKSAGHLITSIRDGVHPLTLSEEIISDAILSYFAGKTFLKKNECRRKETEVLENRTITKKTWLSETLNFLKEKEFFTDYSRSLSGKKYGDNITILELKVNEADKAIRSKEEPGLATINEGKKRKEMPEKGIETMFRILSGNNQRLRSLADNKAHILITVNSILLSAIISLLLRKVGDNAYLIVPTIITLTVSLVSMTFAIMATRPKVPIVHSLRTKDGKIDDLMFFGIYYKMDVEEYTNQMFKVMGDWNLLYRTMIMDIHSQGMMVRTKFQFLKWAYNVFLFGLVVGVLGFIIAILIHTPTTVPPITGVNK